MLITTKLDNSQSTVSSNVAHEIVEERKKRDVVFRRVNNTARKTEKSNNLGNSFQNSSSKPKVSNESYCSPYNSNYF